MNYTIPTNLLSTRNAKTVKGEKLGITTYIMYLAPHKDNVKGVNLCAKATEGCISACLFGSGSARFLSVQKGKRNKSNYFVSNRDAFMNQLVNEITKIVERHNSIVGDELLNKNGTVIRYKKFAIRLNGTSDIPFENIKIQGKNIFELFPDVQFYDYTKLYNRYNKVIPNNYHLTFSRSENNYTESLDLLNRGYNVAMVFDYKDFSELPNTYLGFDIVNGDETDLRFLDDENVIVALKYKRLTGKGTSGKNQNNIENNDFIINVKNFELV